MNLRPAPNEKTWPAALAHLSILIPGIGFIVPLMLWFWQRKNGLFVRVQILQAFVFQMMQVVFWQVVLLVLALLLLLFQMVNAGLNPHISTQKVVLLQALTVMSAVFLGVNLVYIGIAVWAAVMVFLGKEWHYPWIGRKILRSLVVKEQIDPDFEIRLIAAMNHFFIFYGLSGLFVPFLTWIMGKEDSKYLRYHSLQALVLQFFSQVLFHLLLVLQSVLAIPLMMVVFSMLNQSATMIYSRTLVMVSLVASGLVMILFFLVIPILAVYATIAGIRILKNKPYDYPMIGKKIKKQINVAPV